LSLAKGKKIFHTQCAIEGKVWDLILDRGSSTNVASLALIDQLQLQN